MIGKTPKGKEVLDGDKFIFNKAFTNALYKIKINQVPVLVACPLLFPQIPGQAREKCGFIGDF